MKRLFGILCTVLVAHSYWLNKADTIFQQGFKAYQNKDYEQAKKYYEQACELNSDLACHALGILYEYGINAKQDYKQAMKFYEKACYLNNGLACNNVGFLYKNGQGVKKDYQKARQYWDLGCKLDDGLSCYGLSYLYENGLGTKQDKKTAKKYWDRAYNLGLKLDNVYWKMQKNNDTKK